MSLPSLNKVITYLPTYMYTEFMLCSPFFRIFGSVAEYFEIQHPLLWFAGECGA